MKKEIPFYEVKVSKFEQELFEQEVRKTICADPKYVKLTKQIEVVRAKQTALDKKHDEIIAQICATSDELSALYNKCFEVECELEEKIRTELMQNPEMAKLVHVGDK